MEQIYFLCDDLLPNFLQLQRATARNWRTGKFEHANYRISKRYFIAAKVSSKRAIPSQKELNLKTFKIWLSFCWFQLNRATVHDIHGNLIHANYRISKRYLQTNLEWLFNSCTCTLICCMDNHVLPLYCGHTRDSLNVMILGGVLVVFNVARTMHNNCPN